MKLKVKKILICLFVPLIVLSCFEWTGGGGSIAVNIGGSKVDAEVGGANEHTSSTPHDNQSTTEKPAKNPYTTKLYPQTTKPPTEPITVEHTEPATTDLQETTGREEPVAEKLIALTFDDGPNPKNTVRILDILKENNSKATFFVIGLNAEVHPEILKQAVDIGCEIGTHSYGHKSFKRMPSKEINNDITKMKKIIFDATGKEPILFRVPFGSFNNRVKAAVGMPIIQWSIDTNDWKYKTTTNDTRTQAELERDKKKIVDSVLKYAKDGDIILMHDIYSMSANACAEFIPKLREMGFKLVTVSELMEAKGIQMQNGKVYRNAY
jgi:peptidoglycan/xylan/chitin deacetylase (PgdA/CDA1 family)